MRTEANWMSGRLFAIGYHERTNALIVQNIELKSWPVLKIILVWMLPFKIPKQKTGWVIPASFEACFKNLHYQFLKQKTPFSFIHSRVYRSLFNLLTDHILRSGINWTIQPLTLRKQRRLRWKGDRDCVHACVREGKCVSVWKERVRRPEIVFSWDK